MPKKANSTSFSKTNQPVNRKPRGKGKKTIIQELMERKGTTELDYLEWAHDISMTPEGKHLSPLFVDAMLPTKEKSTLPKFNLRIRKYTPEHIGKAITKAVADGEMPADVAKQSVAAILSCLFLKEYSEKEELESKLEAIIKEISE